MSDSIVKYDNVLNELSFRGFTENDFNFLMCLCARLKDLGEETQIINYGYIMDLINWDKSQRLDLFHDELKGMSEKLKSIGATVDLNPNEFVSFNLFNTFRANKEKRTLTVSVNKDFKYILNEISGNFTKFELAEYVRLDGKYAKLLYQHLKQYRSSGWWSVSIENFRHDMAIPETYQNKHIMDKVIKPSMAIIKSCKGFSDLSVETKQSERRGRAVIGYKFRWTAEKQVPGQYNLDDYEPVKQKETDSKEEKHKKRSGKNPKNRFNNFHQREYDFDDMERQLLQNDHAEKGVEE